MAIVHPEGWRELAASGAAQREIETLAVLAYGLPDEYTIFHGVHWTRVAHGSYAICGEIDFAILGPTGKLLLIEQKSGLLNETPEGLVKRYAGKTKRVASQLTRNVDALSQRLRDACEQLWPAVDALLYCPDYTLRSPGTAGLDPARIVDATRRAYLVDIVRAILPGDGPRSPLRPKIERFFGEVLELVPEVNAAVGEAHAMYTRLSGGLAEWARRIEFEPFRLRVMGTAGSGKTQLALAVFRDALAAGRVPLYVCYNRPLADHIALIAPPGGVVLTYHQLADHLIRSRGEAPDFTCHDVFSRLERVVDEWQPGPDELVDELIVDEGQDFKPGWAANLLRFLRPQGRAWWLEDPLQNLYERPAPALPGWVTVHADINYRSPREILNALNHLLPGRAAHAGSPLAGAEIEIHPYRNADELASRSVAALTRAIGLGFKRQHIALISFRGREHSRLTPYDRLGPFSLKAPTGHYDLLGNPMFTDGDILIDSVHRFKGRSAPCVVLTEIDFEELDERAIRRLFVGATRATMKLILVASLHAATVLRERLGLGE